MREENLKRLSSINLNRNSADYICMHYLVKDLFDLIPKYAHGDVLDVGCGNKPYESLFSATTSSYIGCDVIQSNEQKVDVICEATNIQFESESFDTVFSSQVLEHVGDTNTMMQECNRVLKKDGILIFSVPFCWELHEEPYDFFRFTKYGLQELCDRHGFETIVIKPNGGKWAALMQLHVNIIYSTFRNRTFFKKMLKFLFINLHFTAFLNSLAIGFDKRHYDSLLTLNYVLVARKKTNTLN